MLLVLDADFVNGGCVDALVLADDGILFIKFSAGNGHIAACVNVQGRHLTLFSILLNNGHMILKLLNLTFFLVSHEVVSILIGMGIWLSFGIGDLLVLNLLFLSPLSDLLTLLCSKLSRFEQSLTFSSLL